MQDRFKFRFWSIKDKQFIYDDCYMQTAFNTMPVICFVDYIQRIINPTFRKLYYSVQRNFTEHLLQEWEKKE